MEITARGLWTLIHGMGFGALYLLACSGAVVEIGRRCSRAAAGPLTARDDAFLRIYLATMAALAWLTVLTGAYIIYPWYRAAAPPGTVDLADYPQRLLMSRPTTAAWHSIGMEWKEHVAWLAPLSITMASAVFFRYGRSLSRHALLRNTILGFVVVSFLAAAIAGFFGSMLNKNAPVRGGRTIQLVQAE